MGGFRHDHQRQSPGRPNYLIICQHSCHGNHALHSTLYIAKLWSHLIGVNGDRIWFVTVNLGLSGVVNRGVYSRLRLGRGQIICRPSLSWLLDAWNSVEFLHGCSVLLLGRSIWPSAFKTIVCLAFPPAKLTGMRFYSQIQPFHIGISAIFGMFFFITVLYLSYFWWKRQIYLFLIPTNLMSELWLLKTRASLALLISYGMQRIWSPGKHLVIGLSRQSSPGLRD